MLGATGIELLRVDLVAVRVYSQRSDDILFLCICTSQIKGKLFRGTSVCNIEVLNLNFGIGQTGRNTFGTESAPGKDLRGQETQGV